MEKSETSQKQAYDSELVDEINKDLNEELYIFEPQKNRYTKEQILDALRTCLTQVSPLIKPTKTLQNMIYFILKAFFIDGKKYVVANCPTGSGKTIIGFMTYFCTQYLYYKYDCEIENVQARPTFEEVPNGFETICYFLTSNKALQNQIDNDINRFDFFDYLYMLKGTSNYPCIEATNKLENIKALLKQDYRLVQQRDMTFYEKVKEDNPSLEFASYKFRPCVGYSGEKLEKKFPQCFNKCPYKEARHQAAYKACTILNYAYFLNVMRTCDAEFGQYFRRRELTICDEAHLLPDIVCNMFNFEFTAYLPKRIQKYLNDIMKYGINFENTIQTDLAKCIQFFYNPVNRPSEIIAYVKKLISLKEPLKAIHKQANSGPSGQSYSMTFNETYQSILEDMISFEMQLEQIESLINQRPEDIYFESEQSSKQMGIEEYKHTLKDLKEAELVQKHMLSKINYGLFMSATLGDVDEYATLMGMHEDEYEGLMLPSTFDFSRSPIYMCESGYLSYNTFDRNIDKVLQDAIKICNKHPNEKGLIHTSTFKITNLLREKLNQIANAVDTSRFLFYQNAKEKEEQIELLRNSNKPYILIGPSMYEGIDLPDDLCRFQILVKVPYAQISGYVKKKMERYPFWYKRNCVEKVVQAIGRSNRHKNDYSTIYLLDNLFEKIIYDTTDEIQERLEYRKIY